MTRAPRYTRTLRYPAARAVAPAASGPHPRELPPLRPLHGAPRPVPAPLLWSTPARGDGPSGWRPLRAWLFSLGEHHSPLARHPGYCPDAAPSGSKQGSPAATLPAEAGPPPAESLLVLAELPGVHPADVLAEVHGIVLTIESGPPLRCYRELLLPFPARLQRQELRDGLLELLLEPLTPPCPAEPLPEGPADPDAADPAAPRPSPPPHPRRTRS